MLAFSLVVVIVVHVFSSGKFWLNFTLDRYFHAIQAGKCEEKKHPLVSLKQTSKASSLPVQTSLKVLAILLVGYINRQAIIIAITITIIIITFILNIIPTH